MKKLLIIISIVLLAGTAYLTYEKWVKHADLTIRSFISEDAAVVLELEVLKDYKTIKDYPIWKTLRKTSGFGKMEKGIHFLDSINGKGGFEAIFKDAPVLISVHKVSNDDLDFLFVLDIRNISQNAFVGAAIGRLENSGYRLKTRNYDGFKISEVSKEGKTFASIFLKNYLLASFTPYLVEDAIRTISTGGLTSFESTFLTIDDTPVNGILNLYINYRQVENLLSLITTGSYSLPITSGRYGLSMDSAYFQLSGFSSIEKGWLSTHKRGPSTFDMAEVVPDNTGYMYHITSEQISEWKEAQFEYLARHQPHIKKYQDSLKRVFNFHADQVPDLIADEIGLVTLEADHLGDTKRLCILEVKDVEESLDFFQHLTDRIILSRGDSTYTESYSDDEIRFLPLQDFPKTFLGDLAGSFDQCFYINYHNYLIFSNHLQELKTVISSIQNEDTWGKSLKMTKFLNQADNAANVSLFVNVPGVWNRVTKDVQDAWSEHFKLNEPAYTSFELAAFQFSYLDGQYFTHFTFSHEKQPSSYLLQPDVGTNPAFVHPLITKPFLLRTHSYGDFDFLVQDSTHAIHYLDKDQNILWSKELTGSIISDIFPIDYYKNGKLQYVFATASDIHIWDKTGKPIPGFPKAFARPSSIAYFNLIDYDSNKNYRMAITDLEGRIYLTDKYLNALDGWSPRLFDGAALNPLTHVRLGGSDLMITVQEDGVIHVMNRRGEPKRGFPFDTEQRLDKNYFLKSGNGLSRSSISVISTGGLLMELTLEGEVIKRTQLLKTTADAAFELLPDRAGTSFLIVRREGRSYELMDNAGNFLFKKEDLSDQPVLIQYYRFGEGRDLIIFTDTASNLLFVYDKSGNLVINDLLSSSHEVGILYSSVKKAVDVFSTWGSALERYHFNY